MTDRPTRWLRAADLRVRIPISSSVDSLNVAAAATRYAVSVEVHRQCRT